MGLYSALEDESSVLGLLEGLAAVCFLSIICKEHVKQLITE